MIFHVFISYLDILFCPCKLGLVASAFKPSTQEAEGKGNSVSSKSNHEFQDNLGCTVRPCLQKEEEKEETSLSLLI